MHLERNERRSHDIVDDVCYRQAACYLVHDGACPVSQVQQRSFDAAPNNQLAVSEIPSRTRSAPIFTQQSTYCTGSARCSPHKLRRREVSHVVVFPADGTTSQAISICKASSAATLQWRLLRACGMYAYHAGSVGRGRLGSLPEELASHIR